MMTKFSMRHCSVLIVLFLGARAQAQAPSLSLEEAFKAALGRMESIAIEESRTRQADERARQARGSFLPHLSAGVAYVRQDSPEITAPAPSPLASLTKADQITSRITLTQSLFKGLSDIQRFRASLSSAEAQRLVTENTKLLLYGTVSQAFYRVLAAEKDLANLESLVEIADKRNKSLAAFTKLGRSRRSDLVTSRSQLALLKADAASAASTAATARHQLAYLTGLPVDSKLAEGPAALPERLPSLETYLVALEERPDILALRSQERVAEANVRATKGVYWPALDLTANYYPQRTGLLEDSKWDVGVSLVLPLYQGGALSSQVRESVEARTESSLLLGQARREARMSVENYYKIASGGLAQLKLYREALELVEETYRQVERDFGVGAVTNLEVLQALDNLADARRSVDRVKYETSISLAQLAVAQGKIP